MSDFEDHESMAGITTSYGPAYGMSASSTAGPQCSAHQEFCFFCAYERDPGADSGSTGDLYGSLSDMVQSMVQSGKEFHAIVHAVFTAYRDQIQRHIEDPEYGMSPAWSKESVSRHLTYSSQFKGLFECNVRHIFQSLITAHNSTLIDKSSGEVVEEHRKALMGTLNTYMQWEKFMSGREGARGRR